jgi:hypothetical protein
MNRYVLFGYPNNECSTCSNSLIKSSSSSSSTNVFVCEDCFKSKLNQQLETMEQLSNKVNEYKQRIEQNQQQQRVVKNTRLTHPTKREQRLRQQEMCIQNLRASIQEIKDVNNSERIESLQLSLENQTIDNELKEAVSVLKNSMRLRKVQLSQQPKTIRENRDILQDKLHKCRRRVCRTLFRSIPISIRPIRSYHKDDSEYDEEEDGEIQPLEIITINHVKFGVYRMFIIHDELWIPILLPLSDSNNNNAVNNANNKDTSSDTILSMKDIVKILVNDRINKNGVAQIGKALAYVVYVLNVVASYLSIQLPHKMIYHGSTSTIAVNHSDKLVLPLYYNANYLTNNEQTQFASAIKEYSIQNMTDLFTLGLTKLNENINSLLLNQGIMISNFNTNNFGFNLLCLYQTPTIGTVGPYTYYTKQKTITDKDGFIVARQEYNYNYFVDRGVIKSLDEIVLSCIYRNNRREATAQSLGNTSPSQTQQKIPRKEFDKGFISDFYNEEYINNEDAQ